MFGAGGTKSSLQVSCFMSERGYALVGLNSARQLLFHSVHTLEEFTNEAFTKALSQDVETYQLYGTSCQLVLTPSMYQLVLMDALEVSEKEMAKAVRWQLKGLIDYPLNDIAVDAFTVPPHGVGNKRNKIFAAVSLQSALINRVALFEDALLPLSGVSIAEMALSGLLAQCPNQHDAPAIVISYDEGMCHLYIYMSGDLYLVRALPMTESVIYPGCLAKADMLLEIQRSIDYCLMELKLPEPKAIFFTPSFFRATDLFEYLKTEMGRDIQLLDVNTMLSSTPMSYEDMELVFYAIGGALISGNGRNNK